MSDSFKIIQGDALEKLRELPSESVHCVVTSPPYWGLRDYGTAQWDGGDPDCDHSPERRGGRFSTPVSAKQASNIGSGTASRRDCSCGARRIDRQLGLEPTYHEYLEKMTEVFREVRRVLREDGVIFVNMGDSYATGAGKVGDSPGGGLQGESWKDKGAITSPNRMPQDGLKPKDLVGIPWRLAFALQADGWWLRSDIIWHKPNPMPESVTDRPTKSHEYVFMMTKAERYYYDQEAVREPHVEPNRGNGETEKNNWSVDGNRGSHESVRQYNPSGRNLRTVWTIPTYAFPDAHFATFPPRLVEPCIKAGTSEHGCCPTCGAPWERQVEANEEYKKFIGKAYHDHKLDGVAYGLRQEGKGPVSLPAEAKKETVGWSPTCTCPAADPVPCTVLDPFSGSGTVGIVALQYGRKYIGIELNPTYIEMSEKRLGKGVQKRFAWI